MGVGLLVTVRVRGVGNGAVGLRRGVASVVTGIRLVRVVRGSVIGADSRTGVSSFVARPGVDIGTTNSACNGSASAVSTELRVAIVDGALAIALPEGTTPAAARGVVVGGRGTEALLLLVAAGKPKLADGCNKEEESSNDSDGKTCLVIAAHSAISSLVGDLLAVAGTEAIVAKALASFSVAATERGVDNAGAALSTVPSQDGNGNETASKSNVQNHSEESEDANATEAWREDNSEDSIQDGDTGNALDGLLPVRNGPVAVGLDGQEIRVEAEDDSSAAEAEHVREGPEQATEETHGDGVGLSEDELVLEWRGRVR